MTSVKYASLICDRDTHDLSCIPYTIGLQCCYYSQAHLNGFHSCAYAYSRQGRYSYHDNTDLNKQASPIRLPCTSPRFKTKISLRAFKNQ